MGNHTRKANIEYCTNTKWIAGDIVGLPDGERENYAKVYITIATDYAKERGLEVHPAKGQRGTYHGWNEADFRWSWGLFGSLETIDDHTKHILREADLMGMLAVMRFAMDTHMLGH